MQMSNFLEWLEVLKRPKEVFAREKSKASLVEGLKNYITAAVIVGLLVGLAVAPMNFASLPFLALIMIILSLICISLWQVCIGILYLSVKTLGGVGSFTEHYYLSSLFAAPIAIANAVPVLSMVFLVQLRTEAAFRFVFVEGITLTAFACVAYFMRLSIEEAHHLSSSKTLVSSLVFALIFAAFIATSVIYVLTPIE